MLIDYLTSNFMTLMILLAVAVIMAVNRNSRIPASQLFKLTLLLLFLLTVPAYLDSMTEHEEFGSASFNMPLYIIARTVGDAMSYIICPVIVLLEVYIIVPQKKLKWLCALPAAVNTVIYSTTLFGSHIAFYINDEGRWQRGALGLTVYFVLFFYVFMLFMFSLVHFKRKNYSSSMIVMTIVTQTIFVAYMEYDGKLTGNVNAITALCIFEYYVYLCIIYQQEMRETIAEKELRIAKDSMTLLRGQIQPHFIFNALSIIRSLAKRDSVRAVECIDSFSDYLKAHIGAIQTEDMIMFTKELDHVKAYLALVEADYTRKVEIVYDLQVTDFKLPSLSLEPVVENAVKHGIGRKGGAIGISSYREGDDICIRITDDGTAKNDLTPKAVQRLGVGLNNTRKRLEMQCGGRLETDFSDTGGVVKIIIPINRVKGEENENSGG